MVIFHSYVNVYQRVTGITGIPVVYAILCHSVPYFDGLLPLRHQRPALDLCIAAAEFCYELGLVSKL